MNERAHRVCVGGGQLSADMRPQSAIAPESISETPHHFAFAGTDRDVHSQADEGTSSGMEVRLSFDIRGSGTVNRALYYKIRRP